MAQRFMRRLFGCEVLKVGQTVAAERIDIMLDHNGEVDNGNRACKCGQCERIRNDLNRRNCPPIIEGTVISVYAGVAIEDTEQNMIRVLNCPMIVVHDHDHGFLEVRHMDYSWDVLHRLG